MVQLEKVFTGMITFLVITTHLMITLRHKKSKRAQASGFGIVITHRANGIHRNRNITGFKRLFNENQRVLSNNSSEFYSFKRNALSNQSYPTSVMGSMALIRQFYDLDWYSQGVAKNKDYAIEAAVENASLPKIWNSALI